MEEKCARIWQKLSLALKPEVSADTFKRWFSSVELVQASDEALTFRVPNNIYQFWIESNYMTALQAAVVAALGTPRQINFSAAGSPGPLPPATVQVEPEKDTVSDSSRDLKANTGAVGLNPRNTFESFVIGPNNKIAHAATLEAAQSPGGKPCSRPGPPAHLQPTVHFRRRLFGQDAPDAGDRPIHFGQEEEHEGHV